MNTPVITIANRVPDPVKEPYYCYPQFLASARRHGIEPFFLTGVYDGLMAKPRLLLEYLLKEGARFEHIIVCDAFDILLLTGTDEIIYNYRGFGSPIVFNTERNYFPDAGRRDEFPKSPTPYRFLNSGFFVGDTAAVIHMLETMRDKWGFPADRRKPDGSWETPNDQQTYSAFFLDNQDKVRLDYPGILGQTLHDSGPREFAYVPDRRRVVSLMTGNEPCVIHGNGNGKEWLKRIITWLNL